MAMSQHVRRRRAALGSALLGRPSVTGIVSDDRERIRLVRHSAGGALALWCILTFTVVGRGTPAPFDPPRALVVRGPYRYVRNPMYLGAALALCGAALFYRSIPLFAYAALFLLVTHAFVVWYEEPTLARLFGADYDAYRARVGRWLPRAHQST